MKTEVKKWGNSPVIRIPKAVMEQCHLEVASPINMEVEGNKLIIELDKDCEYSLDELLKQCSPKKMKLTKDDSEWINAKPVGKELL